MNEYKNSTATGISDIGAALTAKREQLGLSVAAAALKSNLDKDLIEKLEANRFSEIGAPVFTRGYLNMYAKALDLDENAVTKRFDALKKDRELSITPANVAGQTKSFKRSYAKTWLLLIPLLIGSVILLQQLLDSNSWLMTQINHAFSSENSGEGSSQPTDQAQKIVLEVGGEENNDTQEQRQAQPAVSEESTGQVQSESQSPALLPVSAPENSKDTGNNIEAGKTDNVTSEESEVKDKNTSAGANTDTSTETSQKAVADKSGMTLHFTGESWIQINNAKSKVLLSRVVKSGEDINFAAGDGPYKLNVGRPENVELTVNGQKQPLGNYRLPGYKRKFKVEIPNG